MVVALGRTAASPEVAGSGVAPGGPALPLRRRPAPLAQPPQRRQTHARRTPLLVVGTALTPSKGAQPRVLLLVSAPQLRQGKVRPLRQLTCARREA